MHIVIAYTALTSPSIRFLTAVVCASCCLSALCAGSRSVFCEAHSSSRAQSGTSSATLYGLSVPNSSACNKKMNRGVTHEIGMQCSEHVLEEVASTRQLWQYK
jgi:hypothetical protein